MPGCHSRSPRRSSDPRGTILIISLLLMVVVAFLGGLVLLLARTEGTLASTSKALMQATNAAEYGMEYAISNINPSQPTTTTPTLTLTRTVYVTSGLRDGSSAVPVNQGAAPCPPGYSLSLGCAAFTVNATGWSRTSLVTVSSVQLQRSDSLWRGCNGTDYC